jgi:hypothetical protein
MILFKALAAAVLLSGTAAPPAFAQAPLGGPPVVVPGSMSSALSKIYTTPGISRRTTSIRTGP